MHTYFDYRAFFICCFIILDNGIGNATTPLPELVVPKTHLPIIVDGKLNDDAWNHAASIDGLHPYLTGTYQHTIDKVPTKIKVLWDDENLYLSFWCLDDEIYASKNDKHDGDLYKKDVCEVFIDGVGDQRQWIEIQVNPFNQTLDMVHLLTKKPYFTKTNVLGPGMRKDLWRYRSWEAAGMKTATSKIYKEGNIIGWTVEIKLPAKNFLKRLGLKKISPMTIRANFMRYDYYLNSDKKREFIHMNWAPVLRGCPHLSPAAMGFLKLSNNLTK